MNSKFAAANIDKIRSGPLNLVVLSLVFILAGCGDPGVNVNNPPYNPKIAVEGFLYPGQTVSGIRLMRNFPIRDSVNLDDLYLAPSANAVTATINDSTLTYDSRTQTYFNDRMTIDYGATYTLDVYAVIDGALLHATSTTITPQRGFGVSNTDPGKIDNVHDSASVHYRPSQGTDFYACTVLQETIRDTIYGYAYSESFTPDSNLNNDTFPYGVSDNVHYYPDTTYSITFHISVPYSASKVIQLKVVAYACDANFRSFVLTAPTIQGIAGNYFQPVGTFMGDGIGVFGSAIADTVWISDRGRSVP